MFFKKNNRKTKKIYKKIAFLIVLFIALGLLIYFGFNLLIKKPLFISPVPNQLLANVGKLAKSISAKKQNDILTIEEELKKEGIQFSKVETATNSAILVYLAEGGEVVFSQVKDLGDQISSLQRILSRFTIEGKKFELLDLRFDRPFVKLK